MTKQKRQHKCKQCKEYLAGWQRAQADYENLKKQTLKEKEEFAKFANLNLIISLIPVYNNFKLSFEHLPKDLKDNDWVKGVDHIEKQFMKVLEENGLQQIKPEVGDEFDVMEHEAVSDEEIKDIKEIKGDKINKVISVGYKLKDKVIMPAKVVVK